MSNVPNIGDIVEYSGLTDHGSYRVTGYARNVIVKVGAFSVSGVEVLPGRSFAAKAFCVKENAEFVLGCGVSGIVAPLDEVRVTGRVNWTDEQIADSVAEHALCVKDSAEFYF